VLVPGRCYRCINGKPCKLHTWQVRKSDVSLTRRLWSLIVSYHGGGAWPPWPTLRTVSENLTSTTGCTVYMHSYQRWYCQKYSFRCVSDDDIWRSRRCSFWQAAKTGGRRTTVTFGRQPTQVFSWPCRRTKSVIALRRNFWLERLTEGKECRKWYETRPPGWEYSLSWTLSVRTCSLEPVLNKRAQACSEAFWRPRKSHLLTSWCLGRSLHCPVLSVKGQKSKLPWNAVMISWRQPAVKTCDDVHDWQGVSGEDFDGADGESTKSYRRPGGKFAATRKKSSYPSDWQTALKRDCASLQPTVWEYFVTLL